MKGDFEKNSKEIKSTEETSLGFFNGNDMEDIPSNGAFLALEDSVSTVYTAATRKVSYLEVRTQLDAFLNRKVQEHVFLNDELGLRKALFDVCVLAVLEPDKTKEYVHIPRFNEECVQAQQVCIEKIRRFLEAGKEYMDFLPQCQQEIDTKFNTKAVSKIGQLIDRVLKLNVAQGALNEIKLNLRFIILEKEINSLEHVVTEAVSKLMPLYKSKKNRAAKKSGSAPELADITELLNTLHLFRVKVLISSLYDEAAQNCQMVYDSCSSFFTYIPEREQIRINFEIMREILQFEDIILQGLRTYTNKVVSWPVYNFSAGRVQAVRVQDNSNPEAKKSGLTIDVIRMQIKTNLKLKSDDNIEMVYEFATGKARLLKLQVRLMDLRSNHENYNAEQNTRELEEGLAEAHSLQEEPVFQKYEMLKLNAWENILEIRNNILIVLSLVKEFKPIKPNEVAIYNATRDVIGSPNSSMYKRLLQQKLDFIETIKVIQLIGTNYNSPQNKVFKEFIQLHQNVHLVLLLLQRSLDYYEIIFKCIPQDRVDFKKELLKEQIEFIKLIQEVIDILENKLGQTHIKRLYVKNKLGHSVLIDVQDSNDKLLRQRGGAISIILGKKIELVREYYAAISFGFEKLLSELVAGQRNITTEDYMHSFGASTVLSPEIEELIRQDEEERAQKKRAEEKEVKKEPKKSKRPQAKRQENKTNSDTSKVVAQVKTPNETAVVLKCDADLRIEFDKLLENLYSKQYDFTGLRSTLSELPKLINKAQNLELVFEVNSAMGDAYDMMARKIHISSKTPVTRDRSGRPNGVRKLDKNYDYSKMASETLSCLEASINYYKYSEMVLQKLHGKISEEQYNLKYQWLIICMKERKVKLQELKQRVAEDSEFLLARKRIIREKVGEDRWKSGDPSSQISQYFNALRNCVEPFKKITDSLDDFTTKLAQHKKDDEVYPEMDCAYVSHQYASQTQALPKPEEQGLNQEDEVATDERYEVIDDPNHMVRAYDAGTQMPNFAGNSLPATHLSMPFPLYPPMSLPYQVNMPFALIEQGGKQVCLFKYEDDMLFVDRVYIPKQTQLAVIPFQPQYEIYEALKNFLRYPQSPQSSLPPFALGNPGVASYVATGYTLPSQHPQTLIACELPPSGNRLGSVMQVANGERYA